jgi:hypothetical protein
MAKGCSHNNPYWRLKVKLALCALIFSIVTLEGCISFRNGDMSQAESQENVAYQNKSCNYELVLDYPSDTGALSKNEIIKLINSLLINSGYFSSVKESKDPADLNLIIRINVMLSKSAVSLSGLISGATLGLIPSWFSQDIEVYIDANPDFSYPSPVLAGLR